MVYFAKIPATSKKSVAIRSGVLEGRGRSPRERSHLKIDNLPFSKKKR